MSDSLPRCPVCGVYKGNLARRGGSQPYWSLLNTSRHLLAGLLNDELAALPQNDHICPKCYMRARRRPPPRDPLDEPVAAADEQQPPSTPPPSAPSSSATATPITAATTSTTTTATTPIPTHTHDSPVHATACLTCQPSSLRLSHQTCTRRARQPAAASSRQARPLWSNERFHSYGEAVPARRLGAG